ncbi:MAG: hypothetical protein HY059_18590 [Proteobacteria bacterium]|nr:hypothetical protein [Pseudomonadota bacterium]
MKRLLWTTLACFVCGCAHRPSLIPVETRTYQFLPTGNGLGFQVFDASRHRVVAFLDHPYRYLRAPEKFCRDGPERRNLLKDFSLGVLHGPESVWTEAWAGEDARYLRQTNVVDTSAVIGKIRVKERYFSPYGLGRNALVALARVETETGAAAPDDGMARLSFRLGGNPRSEDIGHSTLRIEDLPGARIQTFGGDAPAWVQTGRGQGALLYIPLIRRVGMECRTTGAAGAAPASRALEELETKCAGDTVDAVLRMPTSEGWFGVVVAYVDDPADAPKALAEIRAWIAGRPPAQLLDDALREFEAWRKPPQARFRSDAEASLWRQSETVLRMSQVLEPNLRGKGALRVNHGMILASLAPGNWATGWVRDGTYATVALARMGHFEEARKSLDFMINAEPIAPPRLREEVNGADYRISLTRHYGSGEEETDCSGQPGPNVEMDGWGLYLWAARQYLEASGDADWLTSATRKGTVYEALRDGVAAPLERNLETPPMPRIMRPDSSIWETNNRRKHFSFTTIAAIRGLCDFAAIARKAGRADDAEKYSRLAEEARAGFMKAYVTPDLGAIGSLDRSPRTDLDGAMIEAVTLGVFANAGDPGARRTLANLERLKLAQGGYKRNGGDDTYEINEWIFIDLRLASALYRAGRGADADELVKRIVRRSSPNFDLIPEEYNDVPKDGPIGSYTGAIPMVGYGSGVLVLSMLDREGLFEPSSCGE